MIVVRAMGSMSKKDIQGNGVCAGLRGSKLTEPMGITLVELMVALAIVAILSSISIPLYAEYIEKARIVRCVAEIKIISQVIDAYATDNSNYPASLADVNFATLLDPWGSSYQYLNIQTAAPGARGRFRRDRFLVPINTDYDLYSMGRDGDSTSPLTARQSRDDIVRANNGAYIGLASEF
jgi:general secretion pathway protein G